MWIPRGGEAAWSNGDGDGKAERGASRVDAKSLKTMQTRPKYSNHPRHGTTAVKGHERERSDRVIERRSL